MIIDYVSAIYIKEEGIMKRIWFHLAKLQMVC